MARNEGDYDRDRWENRDYDRHRSETRDRREGRPAERDRSGGGMTSGWHGRDRDQGYSGGMGSWGSERGENRWGARDNYGQGSEGWNRAGERWGGEQDLGRGEERYGSEGEVWRERQRGREWRHEDEWRGPGRGDEGRDWGRQSDRGRGGEPNWSQHSINWGEGSGTERYRGREAGWGGYGSYDRESQRYGEGRGNTPGYGSGGDEPYRGARGQYGGSRDWNREQVGREWDQGTGATDWERRGAHAGRGPRNYQRSDDRIHEDINQRLTDHPDIDASDVDVEVRSGEVTLRGQVPDRRSKHLAEDLAERVWGVKDVHNELRVQRTDTGNASGAATFHAGSTSYPTLTAPGGRDPNIVSAGHSGAVEQHVTGQQEGSDAGENRQQPAQTRQNISSGDQGTAKQELTGSRR